MLDLSTRPDQAAASACDARPPAPGPVHPIHKALRAFLSDTLVRVGALDARHPKERADTCAQVLAMLEQMRRHLSHENAFIHEALERRSPALCTAIAREHDHQSTAWPIWACWPRRCAMATQATPISWPCACIGTWPTSPPRISCTCARKKP